MQVSNVNGIMSVIGAALSLLTTAEKSVSVFGMDLTSSGGIRHVTRNTNVPFSSFCFGH